MSLEKTVAKIEKWQDNHRIHPLLCGKNSHHKKLYPIIRDEKIILVCGQDSCDYERTDIPAMFTDNHP